MSSQKTTTTTMANITQENNFNLQTHLSKEKLKKITELFNDNRVPILYEQVDKKVVVALAKQYKKIDKDIYKKLWKYSQQPYDNDKGFQIQYSTRTDNNFGRLYPGNNGEKGLLSLANLNSNISKFLAQEIYQEYDMAKAAPSIIKSLLEYYNLNNNDLNNFLHEPDGFLMRNEIGSKSDLYKHFFSSNYFNKKLPSEVHSICTTIYKHLIPKLKDEFEDVWNLAEQQKYNKTGKFFSWILFACESKCLIAVTSYLQEKQHQIGAYKMDGFYIKSHDDDLSDEINNYCLQETGFQIRFVKKNLESDITVDTKYFEEEEEAKGFAIVAKCLDAFFESENLCYKGTNFYQLQPDTMFYYKLLYTSVDDIGRLLIVKYDEVEKYQQQSPQLFYTNLKAYLKVAKLPLYQPDRNYYEFRNGVFFIGDKKNLPRIYEKSELDSIVAFNYFDVEFSPDDLKTPSCDNLLRTQLKGNCGNIDIAQNNLMMMLFGRTLFPLGFDDFKMCVLLWGQSGAGKTQLTTILGCLFKNDFYKMTENTMRDKFGHHECKDKPLAILSDCNADFVKKLDIDFFKNWIDADIMTSRGLYKEYETYRMVCHLIITSNFEPVIEQAFNEISRRLFIVKCDTVPDTIIYDLGIKIYEQEIMKLLWKSVHLYHEALHYDGHISELLDPFFIENRREIENSNDELVKFFQSDNCPFEISSNENDKILWSEIKGHLPSHVRLNPSTIQNIGLKKKNEKTCKACHNQTGTRDRPCCSSYDRKRRTTNLYLTNLKRNKH